MLKDWVRAKLAAKLFTEGGAERILLQDWDTPPADPELAKDKRNWGGTRHHISVDDFCALYEPELIKHLPATANPKAFSATSKITKADLVAADEADEVVEENGQQVTRRVNRGLEKYFAQWAAEGIIPEV